MLSLLRHYKAVPNDLLTSKLYDERTFYEAFINDLKHCKQEIVIESPYITTKRVTVLCPALKKLIKHGVKVTVNTRHPKDHNELRRVQAWMAIKTLRSIGIKVRFFTDYHHRKIAVLDGRILWEGSLNILSQCNSREIMRRIESEELTKQMIRFLRLNRLYW